MHYYKLKEACGTEETGPNYPQTDGMVGDYDFNSKDSIYQLNVNTIPNTITDFGIIKLAHSSNLTDIISIALISSAGLIVSEKVKNIFEQYSIQKSIYIKLKIQHKNRIIDSNYYRLFIETENQTRRIDYVNSKFYISQFGNDRGDVEVKSEDDFVKKSGEVQSIYNWSYIVPKFLTFRSNGLDLFTYPMGLGLIITTRLKNELVDNAITGIKFDELENAEII